jgi:hypothetical protein
MRARGGPCHRAHNGRLDRGQERIEKGDLGQHDASVEESLARFAEGWKTNDGAALAEFFVDDGSLVNPSASGPMCERRSAPRTPSTSADCCRGRRPPSPSTASALWASTTPSLTPSNRSVAQSRGAPRRPPRARFSSATRQLAVRRRPSQCDTSIHGLHLPSGVQPGPGLDMTAALRLVRPPRGAPTPTPAMDRELLDVAECHFESPVTCSAQVLEQRIVLTHTTSIAPPARRAPTVGNPTINDVSTESGSQLRRGPRRAKHERSRVPVIGQRDHRAEAAGARPHSPALTPPGRRTSESITAAGRCRRATRA